MNTEKTITSTELPPGSRGYKRSARNIFIHKPMQREFIFVVVALLMVSTLAIAFIIHHTIYSAVQGGGFRFGTISPYEVLSDVSYQLIVRVAFVLFATLVVIGAFGILFLHRVAGPVYRFRSVFMRLSKGELPAQIKLREGDFFQETASEINALIKQLHLEQEKDQTILQKINQLLAANPPENVAKIAREIQHSLERKH